MTVAAAAAKAGPFLGNDVTTVFPFEFKVFVPTDVRVVHTAANLDETDLTTGFTTTLNADQNNDPGGNVTLDVTLPTGEKLTLVPNLAYEQETDITNAGGFHPQVVEDMNDRNTILCKQLREELDRAVKVPVSSDVDPEDYLTVIHQDRDAAEAAAAAAETSADAAHAWAQEDEDVAVDDGEHASGFSAYHWSQKAMDVVIGAIPPHTHPESDVTNLVTDLAGKAAVSHTHAEGDVTGLTAALAAKAPLASPVFTGNPQAPTQAQGTSDAQLATTAFVNAEIAADAPTKTGGGASGTWDISISGSAVTAGFATEAAHAGDAGFATTAGNGLVALHAGGTIRAANGTNALGADNAGLWITGITVDTMGRVTALRAAESPSGNSSIHPDSQIQMAGGHFQWLRDIRLGDRVRGRNGEAEVLGIWTNTLQERSLWEVNGVACTPGHLFPTRNGWGAASPRHYRENSHGKRRVVKGRRGMIETVCLLCEPDAVEQLAEGVEILADDGSWKSIHTIKEYPVEGEGRRINVHQQVIALFLDGSNIFYADGYAVATLA